MAYKTSERKRQIGRDYYWRHIEESHLSSKHYRDANKDRLNAEQRKYRQANREQLQTYHAQYYAVNRERLIAQEKDYRILHSEQLKASDHQYYLLHRKERLAYQKENQWKWREYDRANYRANPAKFLIKSHRRLALQKSLLATLTTEQWEHIKSAYGNRCIYCGKSPQRLTQDHLIPLSRGGPYTADNIVPACSVCNTSKGNRIPIRPIQLRLLLAGE